MLFHKGLKIIQYLSLDIALGTVCMAVFIANHFNVTIDVPVLLILFFSTWFVYTLDHLFDAYKYSQYSFDLNQWSGRHKFHFLYKKQIFLALISVFVLQCVLLIFLSKKLLLCGVVLVFIVIIYMLFTHVFRMKLLLLKEVMIAIIYSISILLPTILSFNHGFSSIISKMSMYFAALFLIAISNILLITCYEMKNDIYFNESFSFGMRMGKKLGLKIVFTLVMAYMVFILVNISNFKIYAIYWLAMGAVLLLICSFIKFFEIKNRYRNYADMVFLIPILSQLLDILFFNG